MHESVLRAIAMTDQGKSRQWAVVLFSGAGGAVLAVIVGVLIGSGQTVVSTVTVHGPTVTQYVSVGPTAQRPCAGTKVAGGPPYEPNNSIAEAYGPLKSGQPIDASLGSPHETTEGDEDQDFYAFCIGHAAVVNAQLRKTGCEPETEEFSTSCFELQEELINNQGESLQAATVGETTQATLVKHLAPGRYYIRVHNARGAKYELEVSAGTVPLQPSAP
jgi:hypothetical protein